MLSVAAPYCGIGPVPEESGGGSFRRRGYGGHEPILGSGGCGPGGTAIRCGGERSARDVRGVVVLARRPTDPTDRLVPRTTERPPSRRHVRRAGRFVRGALSGT